MSAVEIDADAVIAAEAIVAYVREADVSPVLGERVVAVAIASAFHDGAAAALAETLRSIDQLIAAHRRGGRMIVADILRGPRAQVELQLREATARRPT